MTRLTTFVGALAVIGLIGVTSCGAASAAPPASPPQAQQQASRQGDMQKQQAQMMQMHQKMMADMTAMDDQLNALVAKMNAASGQDKTEAIAELLTAMVKQQTSMRGGMMQMGCQMMMGQMMQGRGGAMSAEMKKMMADCPMMKMMTN
jgi:hypothetical protein